MTREHCGKYYFLCLIVATVSSSLSFRDNWPIRSAKAMYYIREQSRCRYNEWINKR